MPRHRRIRALQFRAVSGTDTGPIRIVPGQADRRLSTGFGVFFIAIAVVMSSTEIFRPPPFQSLSQSLPVLGLYASFALLGLFLLVEGRRLLELENDAFSISLLVRRKYSCSDFTGYRHATTPVRDGYATRYWLVGKPGCRDVTILGVRNSNDVYSVDDVRRLRSWLDSHYPDLEAADEATEARDRGEKRLHPDIAAAKPLGLRRARALAIALSSTSFALIGIALSFPFSRFAKEPAVTIFAVACCVLLPVVLAVKLWQPDSFELGSFVGQKLPASLSPALVVGSMAPFVPALVYFRPLRWISPIPRGLLLSAILAALLLRFGMRRLDRTPGVLGAVLLQLAAYGFAAVTVLNGALDRSRPSMTTGVILDRAESGSDGRRVYILVFQLEKPIHAQRDVRVSRDLYARARVGDAREVFVGGGALGIPWIRGVSGP